MPASRSFRRHGGLVALMVAALCATVVPSARAQSSDVTLELVGQPISHGPDDPLGLRLRISNAGTASLDGFRLQVRAYAAAGTRSDLHENFEIDPLSVEYSSLGIDRPDINVPAGTSRTVTIDAPLAGLTSIVGGAPGVYPITVTLTDVDGLSGLDSVTTQLLYFPDEVETPLNVVVFWPLTDLPSRGAGGVFTGNAEGSALQGAIGETGWLSGVLDALEARAASELRLGLVPGARLVEELGDMSDGFRTDDAATDDATATDGQVAEVARASLGRLRDLAGASHIQTVHAPYAFPDLTSIDDFEQFSAQLTASGTVLEEELGVSPDDGWLFAPGGRLDDVTMERLRSADAAAGTIFSADSLQPEALDALTTCRQDFVGITYTCPVKVTTPSGSARGYVLDPELQERFGAMVSSPGNVVEMQRLLAELAMIYLELPGTSARVIALAVPPLWHPPPTVTARFVRALASSPWVATKTPRAGLHLGIGAIERDLVTTAPPTRSQPDDIYMQEIDEAAEIVDSFARIEPPVALVQRLRRDVLIGQSLLWWGDEPNGLLQGARFATEARREAEAEMARISIIGRKNITLASKRGTLPLSLQNSNDYPITLEIHLDSADRDLELNETVLDQTFEPGATPLPVTISAQASGIYPVGIRVTSPDGFEIEETSISIRSTEFNEIALAITVGALVFLVVFSVIRGIRKRRIPAAEANAE